ncbi:hypothetical protein BC943DRAFT_331504 [Umbelopsis sp. AD052]|nr:hypothetical protein BC943DRAFT_331504 [Umbelopsis sp. AD052]
MNKLKSTLLRSNKTAQQPLSKLFEEDDMAVRQSSPAVPQLKLSALAEHERLQYFSWWKDLDPFNIGVLDNITILRFLQGCHINDEALEKILRLFDTATDGLKEEQFYAMLRLIAHAQNGRRVTPELVHLGAPVPRFDVHTIDALIKKPQQPSSVPSNDNPPWPSNGMTHHQPNPNNPDPSWWAQQQQQQTIPQEPYIPPPRMERSNAPGPLPSMPNSGGYPQQNVGSRPLSQYGYNGYVNPAASPNSVSPPQPPFTNGSDGGPLTGYIPSKRFSAMITPSDVNFLAFNPPSDASMQQQPFGSVSSSGWVDTQMSWQATPTPQDGQPSWHTSGGDRRSWVPDLPQYNQQPVWVNPEPPTMLQLDTENKLPPLTGNQAGKTVYSHGRSRSVPHASTNSPLLTELNEPLMMSKPHTASELDDMQDMDSPFSGSAVPRSQSRPPVTQRASMDPDSFQKLLTKIDRGESLLLTKGLDFDSGKSLNPFRRSATISHSSRRRVYSNDEDSDSEGPFADQGQATPVQRKSRVRSESLLKAFDDVIPDNLSFIHPNARRNQYDLSPPPIPSQLTKPTSLKYARNRTG